MRFIKYKLHNNFTRNQKSFLKLNTSSFFATKKMKKTFSSIATSRVSPTLNKNLFLDVRKNVFNNKMLVKSKYIDLSLNTRFRCSNFSQRFKVFFQSSAFTTAINLNYSEINNNSKTANSINGVKKLFGVLNQKQNNVIFSNLNQNSNLSFLFCNTKNKFISDKKKTRKKLYSNLQEKFVNLIMKNGKKSKAYTIFYQALKSLYVKNISFSFNSVLPASKIDDLFKNGFSIFKLPTDLINYKKTVLVELNSAIVKKPTKFFHEEETTFQVASKAPFLKRVALQNKKSKSNHKNINLFKFNFNFKSVNTACSNSCFVDKKFVQNTNLYTELFYQQKKPTNLLFYNVFQIKSKHSTIFKHQPLNLLRYKVISRPCYVCTYQQKKFIRIKQSQFTEKLLLQAIKNVQPSVEVRSVKVSGRTYQVPAIVSKKRQQVLAIKWIIDLARKKQKNLNTNFSECLALELFEALKKSGKAKQKRDFLHQLAESNRAYMRFKWW